MKLSTISLAALLATVNALDTSKPFILKAHKLGTDVDGVRLSILGDGMFLADNGGNYLFTLSSKGVLMTQYGAGLKFDPTDEVETTTDSTETTDGITFSDDGVMKLPGNGMDLVACPVTGEEARYEVQVGGSCKDGVTFEAKAENDDKPPKWPSPGEYADVDTSKSFGLVVLDGDTDLSGMAIVMLDGDMWLSSVGDAVFNLKNGVLTTSYGKGIKFEHGDQAETSSKDVTTGITVEKDELKVPGDKMGFRLCPTVGKIAPYEIQTGGKCRDGSDVIVKLAPLDDSRDYSTMTQGKSDGKSSTKDSKDSASKTSSATSSPSSSATPTSAGSSESTASSSSDGTNAANLNVASAGVIVAAFAALLV